MRRIVPLTVAAAVLPLPVSLLVGWVVAQHPYLQLAPWFLPVFVIVDWGGVTGINLRYLLTHEFVTGYRIVEGGFELRISYRSLGRVVFVPWAKAGRVSDRPGRKYPGIKVRVEVDLIPGSCEHKLVQRWPGSGIAVRIASSDWERIRGRVPEVAGPPPAPPVG